MDTTQAFLQREATLASEKATLSAEAVGIGQRAKSENRELTTEEAGRFDAILARKSEVEASEAKVAGDRARHESYLKLVRESAAVTAVSDVTDRGGLKAWGADFGADKILADKTASRERHVWARNLALGEQARAIMAHTLGQGSDPRLFAAPPGRGLNETVGPDGGYLVSEDVINDIRVELMAGELLSRVNSLTLSSGATSVRINSLVRTSEADGSQFGGVQVYWLEEGALKQATKPQFDFIRLEVHKIAGLTVATDEVLQDVGLLGGLIFRVLTAALRWKIESAIWGGNGSAKPLGFANSANPALITVSKEALQPANTITGQNLIDMWSRFYSSSRSASRTAAWFINQDVEGQLLTASVPIGMGGQLLLMPANGLIGRPQNTIYGLPVVPVAYASTLGTVGDIVLADLDAYWYIEKGGVQTASSIHLYFDYDETAFRAVARVDGAPAWKSTLTPAVGSNSTSPFVALATRA